MKIESVITPRLYAIAESVPAMSRLADVGTDHAYIPIYLCLQGKLKRALAMDVRPGPLERAAENIERFHLSDVIETRLSDGLLAVCEGEIDTAVIAGMGGMLIAEILEKAPVTLETYILQPMTAVAELRQYLESHGYMIEHERLAREDEKLYTVMTVKHGTMKVSDPVYYQVGQKLMEERDPLVPDYIEMLLRKYSAAERAVKNAKSEEVRQKQAEFQELLCGLSRLKEECMTW